VDRRALDDREPAVGALDEALALEDPDRAAVLAPEADLVVRQVLPLEQLGDRGLAVLALQVHVPGGLLEHLLARGVAEDAREGLVAVEDPAVERGAVHAREVALEEGAVAFLGEPQRLLDLAPSADVGHGADAAGRPPLAAAQERPAVMPVEEAAVLALDA